MLDAKEPNVTDQFQALNYPTELEQERAGLADVLRELHDLLEEYAPSWYTHEHHEKAESALRSAKKFSRSPRANGSH